MKQLIARTSDNNLWTLAMQTGNGYIFFRGSKQTEIYLDGKNFSASRPVILQIGRKKVQL